MGFLIDTQELKPGLIIFRRGDVKHRNWYCRVKLPKTDRYKSVSLKTADIDAAKEKAFNDQATAAIRVLPDFKVATLRQRRLELYLHEEAVNTAALAGVFSILTDNKIALVSIRSVGQQTEQAFLDLVEKEESRGFARIYQAEAA